MLKSPIWLKPAQMLAIMSYHLCENNGSKITNFLEAVRSPHENPPITLDFCVTNELILLCSCDRKAIGKFNQSG